MRPRRTAIKSPFLPPYASNDGQTARGQEPLKRAKPSDWRNPGPVGCMRPIAATGRLNSLKRRDLVERRSEAQSLRLPRSEEHTSELQSLMRISYAVFCLQKKKKNR